MQEKMKVVRLRDGFIAALDQSGGSTPKALETYGVFPNEYDGEAQMYDKVHEMRTRIMASPAFTSEHILGVILFENTMDKMVEGQKTSDYLWDKKNIVSFLKVDKGLAPIQDGVQLMNPMPDLDKLLDRANENHIFGTKMRSLIKEANHIGIKNIVKQQFEVARQIAKAGLVPIIEPEIDIYSKDKAESEKILLRLLEDELKTWDLPIPVMFKLSLPTTPDFYEALVKHPKVLRFVALSGGYSQDEANEILKLNHGVIASFSRALAQGLEKQMSDQEFDDHLGRSIQNIYEASIT